MLAAYLDLFLALFSLFFFYNTNYYYIQTITIKGKNPCKDTLPLAINLLIGTLLSLIHHHKQGERRRNNHKHEQPHEPIRIRAVAL